MKIIINGTGGKKSLEIFDYDDDQTLLDRYAMDVKDSLSLYFRIVDRDFILKDGLTLKVEDVRDTLKKLKAHDLADVEIVTDILSKYSRLKKREIGFLWLILHPGALSKENIEYLKALDRSAFLSEYRTAENLKLYEKEVERINKSRKDEETKEKNIYKQLQNLKKYPVEPFILEEISVETGIVLKKGENIIDVFDAMNVSKNIPFVTLVYKRKRYYKVFSQISPPDEWINAVHLQGDGIYFKLINIPLSKLASTKKIENAYTDGFWSAGDNNLYYTFKIRPKPGVPSGASTDDAEKEIRNKILNSVGDRLEYVINNTRQIGIKGSFIVKNFNLERYIFADLICTDDLFRRFLFLEERSTDKIMTVMTKQKLFVLYTPSANKEETLSIRITSISGETEKGKGPDVLPPSNAESLTIRVSKAQNFQQANAVANTFSKLLTLYNQRAAEIKALYESIIPGLKIVKRTQKKIKGENKKTCKRALDLKKHDESLFRTGYPSQCQRDGHPQIVTKQEADEAVKKFEKAGIQNPTHKIMFFNGSYYICDPREPDDKNMNHIWPGLKPNKISKKLFGDPAKKAAKYAEEHPLVPCCYTTDQYIKKTSHLRMYMAGTVATEATRKEKVDHILRSNVMVPMDRLGEMPFNWEKIFKYLGSKKIVKGKKEFYPILRFGVILSPDSFVHCLERAFNPKYEYLSVENRKKRVMEVRTDISEFSYNLSKQEMYNYIDESITEMLIDPEHYIDPGLFISLFQKYYKCNIFLYVTDSEHLDGDVVIPDYSQAYLARDIDETKPSVLIIQKEVQESDFSYQCEIVVSLSGVQNKEMNFKFSSSSPISKMAIKLFYDSNEVFIINPDGYDLYRPVAE